MERHTRIHTVAQSGAGQDWAWGGPNGQRFRVGAIRGLFTTSATAATRFCKFDVSDKDGNLLASISAVGGITASQATVFTLVPGGAGPYVSGLVELLPFPDLWLPDGVKIASDTLAIQSTDQWSQVVITYEIEC